MRATRTARARISGDSRFPAGHRVRRISRWRAGKCDWGKRPEWPPQYGCTQPVTTPSSWSTPSLTSSLVTGQGARRVGTLPRCRSSCEPWPSHLWGGATAHGARGTDCAGPQRDECAAPQRDANDPRSRNCFSAANRRGTGEPITATSASTFDLEKPPALSACWTRPLVTDVRQARGIAAGPQEIT